jgi:pimeloyl-ACP methyl ester carboxylesterase
MVRIGARGCRLLAVALGAALFILIAAGWFVTLLLTHPDRADLGAAPPDLRANDVAFRSRSGAMLRGWYIAGRPGAGAVALLHGVHANRLAMLGRARLLATAGYSVLLFDFQSHGESEGEAITFGYRERLDVLAAVEYLQATAPGNRIGLVGVSMGGAAALLVTAELPVDALVLEQVYPTIEEALDNRLRLYLGSAGTLLSPMLEREMAFHLGLDPAQMRPIDHIRDVHAPLLIIAGEADRHTTLAQSRMMFAAASEPKQVWIVPGASHVDLQALAGEEYARRVVAFLGPLLATK